MTSTHNPHNCCRTSDQPVGVRPRLLALLSSDPGHPDAYYASLLGVSRARIQSLRSHLNLPPKPHPLPSPKTPIAETLHSLKSRGWSWSDIGRSIEAHPKTVHAWAYSKTSPLHPVHALALLLSLLPLTPPTPQRYINVGPSFSPKNP